MVWTILHLGESLRCCRLVATPSPSVQGLARIASEGFPPNSSSSAKARAGLSTLCSFFVLRSGHRDFVELDMPDLESIRAEIEHMRVQVGRQRREILQLQKAGIPIASAEALLQRTLDKIDRLCAERDRLKAQLPRKNKVLGGRS